MPSRARRSGTVYHACPVSGEPVRQDSARLRPRGSLRCGRKRSRVDPEIPFFQTSDVNV